MVERCRHFRESVARIEPRGQDRSEQTGRLCSRGQRQFIMFEDKEIKDVVVTELKRFDDARGWLSELYRRDQIAAEFFPAMAYVSATRPGVTRGPHEHVDQADLFCFMGPSNFKLR